MDNTHSFYFFKCKVLWYKVKMKWLIPLTVTNKFQLLFFWWIKIINIYEEPQLQLNFLFYDVPAGVWVSARVHSDILIVCRQSTGNLQPFKTWHLYCIGLMLKYLQPTRQTTILCLESNLTNRPPINFILSLSTS